MGERPKQKWGVSLALQTLDVDSFTDRQKGMRNNGRGEHHNVLVSLPALLRIFRIRQRLGLRRAGALIVGANVEENILFPIAPVRSESKDRIDSKGGSNGYGQRRHSEHRHIGSC